MALFIVLFPLAYHRVKQDTESNILPKVVLGGSGVTVVLAHTDSGLAAVLFSTIFLYFLYSRVYIRNVAAKHFLQLLPILFITTAIGIWLILVSGWFPNSQPRVGQYVTAWQIWIENPIFGVGGSNSNILYDVKIHNFLLSYLAELGILATGIYISVVISCLIKFIYTYFEYKLRGGHIFGAFICILLSFHLYISLTTVFNSWLIQSAFWMVMIIGVRELPTVESSR
jgi:hypothetical protein